MLDPAIVASLAVKQLSNIALSGFDDMAQKLTERVFQAKKQHAEMQSDLGDPIEAERNACLQRICDLQQDIVLYVSDAEFLKRVLPLSLDLIGNIYEAKSKTELGILKIGISRIENALKAYKNNKKKRKLIRLWAIIITLLSMVGVGLFIWLSQGLYDQYSYVSILMLPVPVLLWSIIGSFAAILYRFTYAGDNELNEPLKWLFARPLSGIIMGAIAYMILNVGLMTINSSQDANQPAVTLGNTQVMWLIAFLAGFSDRFSDYLLKTVVGKFGGNTEGDLITLEMSNKVVTNGQSDAGSNSNPILNYLMPNRWRSSTSTNSGAAATNGTENGNKPKSANGNQSGTGNGNTSVAEDEAKSNVPTEGTPPVAKENASFTTPENSAETTRENSVLNEGTNAAAVAPQDENETTTTTESKLKIVAVRDGKADN